MSLSECSGLVVVVHSLSEVTAARHQTKHNTRQHNTASLFCWGKKINSLDSRVNASVRGFTVLSRSRLRKLDAVPSPTDTHTHTQADKHVLRLNTVK